MNFAEFENLRKEIERDLNLNEDNLIEKSIQISNYYTKYLKVYSKELLILKKLFVEKEKRYNELYKKYRFSQDDKFGFELSTKSDIDAFICSNDEYYKKNVKYHSQEVVVKYLEETIKSINTMGFRIKNHIDLMKMKKGLI